jgi:hypothetical protein
MDKMNLSQAVAVAAHITPAAARAASSYYTAAVDASKFSRLLGLLQIGTLAGNASIAGVFQHSSGSASDGSDWAAISSASCTTGNYGSGSNDKVAQLELRVDQNPATSRYVRLAVANATSTWIGGAVVLGVAARHNPASDYKHADAVAAVVY